jgi:hypothetical protein
MDGQTDRQRDRLTDIKELTVAFRNFANSLNNGTDYFKIRDFGGEI